jgi:hypothetical protein
MNALFCGSLVNSFALSICVVGHRGRPPGPLNLIAREAPGFQFRKCTQTARGWNSSRDRRQSTSLRRIVYAAKIFELAHNSDHKSIRDTVALVEAFTATSVGDPVLVHFCKRHIRRLSRSDPEREGTRPSKSGHMQSQSTRIPEWTNRGFARPYKQGSSSTHNAHSF